MVQKLVFSSVERDLAEHRDFTDPIVALRRVNANCPAMIADTQHDLANSLLAGLEAMAARAATLHHESSKVAKAVEDDFGNLADAMLLSSGVRPFPRAHRPAV